MKKEIEKEKEIDEIREKRHTIRKDQKKKEIERIKLKRK